VHQEMENPLMTEELVCGLVVYERNQQFYEMVKELGSQCESDDGNFTLSEAMRKISFSKNVNLVSGFPFLEHNPRRAITALYKELQQSMVEENRMEKIQQLLDQLTGQMRQIGLEAEVELEEIEAPIWLDIFKFFNIRFRTDFNKPEEALSDYFRLMKSYCGYKFFILVNVLGFLDGEALLKLTVQAKYEGFKMLWLENRIDESRQKLAQRVLIVDLDLCEIEIKHL
jgi:CRISPR type II-A-associated protein Csn2